GERYGGVRPACGPEGPFWGAAMSALLARRWGRLESLLSPGQAEKSAPRGRSLLLALSVAGCLALLAPAVQARTFDPQPLDYGATEEEETDDRTFEFRFENKPWGKVLEWLSVQADLPFVMTFTPTGLFTFIPPVRGMRYRLPEIIDILNESL